MTRDEAQDWVEHIVEAYRDLSRVFESADALCGFSADSPFGEAVFKAFDLLMDATAKILDCADSLNWFIMENDCGKKALRHSTPGGTMLVISSIEDFLDCLGY